MNLMRKRVRSFEEYIHKLRRMTHGTTDRSGEIGSNLNNNQDNFSSELKDFKVKIFYNSFIFKFNFYILNENRNIYNLP